MMMKKKKKEEEDNDEEEKDECGCEIDSKTARNHAKEQLR